MSNLNLKIPPVAQGIISLMLIWFLDRQLPIFHINIAFKGAVSIAIIVMGSLVGVLAVAAFIQMRTTVDPRYPEKASRLVVVGIYKYSRNPMYLAILLILVGISIHSGAISSLLVPFLFVAFINRFQIVPEEQMLEQKFGKEYLKYIKQVRRWV